MTNDDRDFFSGILVNPAKISDHDIPKLEGLVSKYPQADILHALLAIAYKGGEASVFEQKLQSASVYSPNRNILYRVINNPETLFRPNRRQNIQVKPAEVEVPVPEVESKATEIAAQTETSETIKPLSKEADQENVFHLKEDAIAVPNDEVFEEITPIEAVDFTDTHTEPAPTAPKIDFLPGVEAATGLDNTESLDITKPEGRSENTENQGVDVNDFLHRRKFRERLAAAFNTVAKTQPKLDEQPAAEVKQTQNPDEGRVSKYDDDKLPYTFMWWLNKTRKEHATVYQPYVTNPLAKRLASHTNSYGTDELQQQYYETIVPLTTVGELEHQQLNPNTQFSGKSSINDIIDSFIKKDPQIQPPAGDKIDTENKAQRSSEDHDDVIVTETLARIYTEQMLYHKAISTYQKLMLKYPEKRAYFASQIELLEKKIN